MTRLLPIIAAAVVAAAALPGMAQAPENGEVEKDIDDITRPPDYDWLRSGESPARTGKGGKPKAKPGEARQRKESRDSREDCGYQPSPGEGPKEPVNLPEGQGGCGNEVGPGTDGISAPPDTGGGGCGQSPMSCGCDEGLGGCGCGDAIGGGMGQFCGGCAGAAPVVGYGLGALAIILVVVLVVRAIAGRRRRDQEIGEELGDYPSEVRISEVHAMPSRSMLDRARAAAQAGDYKTAVGWAYLAGISRLHRWGYTALDRSTTNWTIVSSVRRNGGPHKATAALVRVFEDLFFGGRAATPEMWQKCERILEEELDEAPVDKD